MARNAGRRGRGAIRLTTALYFTPSGRSIINPNAKPGEKPADKPADPKPEAGKPGEKKDDKAATPAAPGATPAPQQSGDPDEPPKDAVADYQLLRAVDLIKGISLYSSKAN